MRTAFPRPTRAGRPLPHDGGHGPVCAGSSRARGGAINLDILAFGAHPDDVELGASGTLVRAARGGARTGVITLTRGEMGSRGTVETRAAESAAAAAVMGLSHHEMLSLPDGRLSPDDESRQLVVREIREHRPRIVLLPYWEDRHPDHPATSRIVQEAAFLSGLKKLDTGQEPHRPAELVYYMTSWELRARVHRGHQRLHRGEAQGY